jgi:hypothetical protein
MLRQNNAQEILEKIEKVFKYTVPASGGQSTTLSAEALAGDSAIALTSETGFADGEHVFIYGSETELVTLLDVDAVPNTTLTRKLAFAHASGSVVSEVVQADLGYIEEGGINVSANFSQSPIGAANARSAIAYIAAEGGEMSMNFGLREANLRNILSSFMIDESALSGAGTATDPYTAIVGRDTIGSQLNHAYRGVCRLINGKTWTVDFLNCAPEVAFSGAIGAMCRCVRPAWSSVAGKERPRA